MKKLKQSTGKKMNPDLKKSSGIVDQMSSNIKHKEVFYLKIIFY